MFLNYFEDCNGIELLDEIVETATCGTEFYGLEHAKLWYWTYCRQEDITDELLRAFHRAHRITFYLRSSATDTPNLQKLIEDYGSLKPTVYMYNTLAKTVSRGRPQDRVEMSELGSFALLSFITTLGLHAKKSRIEKCFDIDIPVQWPVIEQRLADHLFGLAELDGEYYFGLSEHFGLPEPLGTIKNRYLGHCLTDVRHEVYSRGSRKDIKMIDDIVALIGWEGVLR